MPSKGGPVGIDGNECVVTCPMKCGVDDMICPGGKDPNGCPMPDFCFPSKGNNGIGKDGNECPVTCPTKCDDSIDMLCWGDMDDNGCRMPDFCVPQKGDGCPSP